MINVPDCLVPLPSAFVTVTAVAAPSLSTALGARWGGLWRDLRIPSLGWSGRRVPLHTAIPPDSPPVLAREWHGPCPTVVTLSMRTMGATVAEVCRARRLAAEGW